MSSAAMHRVQSPVPELKIWPGTLTLAADGTVSAVSGVIAASAAPASGVYDLTLRDKFPSDAYAFFQMQGATPIVAFPWITAMDLTAGTLSVKPLSATATAATINQVVKLHLVILAKNRL